MILGIDQGTTGTRACLVDAGRIVRSAYAQHAQITPHDGWVEHDPDEIWARVLETISRALGNEQLRIDGIAIANQGETVMLWDAETGRALHNALVWQDTRTADYVAELARDRAVAARVRAETGLGLDPYFSAAKLRWLLDHTAGALECAARGQLRAGTLDSWLIDRLTGGAVFATDVSTAARTQLCDTRSLAWSPFLLELFGIPRAILAEIRDSDGGFGACASSVLGGRLAGVPIIASVVDQPAALAGQGCIDRGDAKATLGTGAFLYVNTGGERPSGEHGTLATVAWRRTGGGACYALDGGVLAFGSAIGWLERIGLLATGELDAVLARRGGRGPAIAVPSLAGLGSPHWNRSAHASWFGLTHATTAEDMVCGVADGLVCRVAEVVDAIERDARTQIRELRVDGGLSRSPALVQLLADMLGRLVVVAEEDEATVLGACTLAELRLGTLTDDNVRARRDRYRARYGPRTTDDERAALRERFARALALTTQFG
jgi:glycerol kinase